MYDTDAMERINVEQIVTATDRLLSGNVRKRRPMARPITCAMIARNTDEPTVYMRGGVRGMRGGVQSARLALFGATAALASLSVAVVCLLA